MHFAAAAAALALLVVLAPAASAAPSPRSVGMLQGGISTACTSAGVQFQSACKDEIDASAQFFGVDSTAATADPSQLAELDLKVSESQMGAFLAKVGPPSAECCKAACEFNRNGCNCDKGVLSLATSFLDGDLSSYRAVAKSFEKSCGFKLYMEGTCPKDSAAFPIGKC